MEDLVIASKHFHNYSVALVTAPEQFCNYSGALSNRCKVFTDSETAPEYFHNYSVAPYQLLLNTYEMLWNGFVTATEHLIETFRNATLTDTVTVSMWRHY